MRKMVKMVTIAAMAVWLAGCQPATGGLPEETLPVETESEQDKTNETEELTESEEVSGDTTEKESESSQPESRIKETTERETERVSAVSKEAEETEKENGSERKKDAETSAVSGSKAEPSQEETQPEAETQAKQEPEKAEEPTPQPAPTASPETQPVVREPEPSAAPEPEPAPQPEATPQPEPEPAPAETQPKTCYDYPFDTGAIRSELIAIGQGAGLTHVEKTPDNSSWAMPVTASESFQGEALKRALADYVSSMPVMVETYGGNPLTEFCIYVEDAGGGAYTFYFLY